MGDSDQTLTLVLLRFLLPVTQPREGPARANGPPYCRPSRTTETS